VPGRYFGQSRRAQSKALPVDHGGQTHTNFKACQNTILSKKKAIAYTETKSSKM